MYRASKVYAPPIFDGGNIARKLQYFFPKICFWINLRTHRINGRTGVGIVVLLIDVDGHYNHGPIGRILWTIYMAKMTRN